MKSGMDCTPMRGSEPYEDLPAELAAPARRALRSIGYVRLEQLARVREEDLLKLHGMGHSALATLREALAERGMSFATDDEL
jgi:hypothetical protein